MNNTIVIYPGGFHGEFFIGNIVTNTDKFHYEYFKCRSEEFNAYNYEAFAYSFESENQSDDIVEYNSSKYGKPIITRTHDHFTKRSMPIIHLYSNDPMYLRRGILLRCIKLLDKTYAIDLITKKVIGPPTHFYELPLDPKISGCHWRQLWMADVPDNKIIFVDIKDWLHNKNLEKIEDFLEIEYTQTMKDAVTQYYERDNVLLDKYFPDWKNHTDTYLLEKMIEVDKEYGFFG